MPYQYRDDLTFADVAFDVIGSSLSEFFTDAADATTHVMISDLKTIENKVTREINLTTSEQEAQAAVGDLLYDLLQKLIYYKDTELLLLRLSQVKATPYELRATAYGEPIDPKKHELGTDVKGVTLHHFKAVKQNDGWAATVVLDI